MPSEEYTKERVMVKEALRRTIRYWAWYSLTPDGKIVIRDFGYRAESATIVVLHSFENPGHFFKDRNGPQSWDVVDRNRLVVFYNPNHGTGYGITIELFLQPE